MQKIQDEVAFSRFTCHFCEQASKTVDKLLNEFPNEINLTFKHILALDEKGLAALPLHILSP